MDLYGRSLKLSDGLGSVRSVVDESTGVLQMRHYAPYGEPWGAQGPTQTPFGFTGEPTDSNGLVHLRARYYNPTLGAFPSLDPIEKNKMRLLSFNRYAYVQNNPIGWSDPSGMIGEQPSGTNCQQNDNTKCPDGTLGTDAFEEFGPGRVKLEKIDISLLSSWGVVLTVACDSNVEWSSTHKSNLTAAFSVISRRFVREGGAARKFKRVFGGLEFRHVGSGIQTGTAAETRSARRIDWGPDSLENLGKEGRTKSSDDRPPATGDYGLSVANDQGIQYTIVHELGHVFDNRVEQIAGVDFSLREIAAAFDLPETDPLTKSVGELRENPTDQSLELAADHFLNWVYSTYSDSLSQVNADKIETYWSGGENPVEESRSASPGIDQWMTWASEFQAEWLPKLEAIIAKLEL